MGFILVLKYIIFVFLSFELEGFLFVYGINNILFIYLLNVVIIVNDCFLDVCFSVVN